MVAAAAEAFGGIDIAVLNAGVDISRNPVEESDLEQWRWVVGVNLFGVYHCARAIIPQLRCRGAGKIITVGSGAGHRGVPRAALPMRPPGRACGCSPGFWVRSCGGTR